ncbi:MAG: diaminopimelate decarboxylase [Treponema sp.]|nr:diaminopimelate decarboxylase [Treponema sp.]
MGLLHPLGRIDSRAIAQAAAEHGTPFYIYDEGAIIDNCRKALAMPHAYGLRVRYAMKANSNRSLLKIIHAQGLSIDASSMNEVRRAVLAGIPFSAILLSTQELPQGKELEDLQNMILGGLTYNICSLRQLHRIGDFAAQHQKALSIRCHPGKGSGESATRNTGDNYSCFGVHQNDLAEAIRYAQEREIIFNMVHVHIGSGGDPAAWRENIDLELAILEKNFPHAQTINFGGGLKVARMPDEKAADIGELGNYAKEKIEAFYQRTNRKLQMEIEPGTFIIAQGGYIVTRVIDKKSTGAQGLSFLVLDGGMELNSRPLLYGARHPFYLVSKKGELLSSEFDPSPGAYEAVPVGRCCESGDSQNLDSEGRNIPRPMAEPELDDYLVIGGAGAYCSAMSPMNYNSHVQAPELLWTQEGSLRVIRQEQTLDQILANEA